MTDGLDKTNVKLHIAHQDQRKAMKALKDEKAQLERAEANLKKRKVKFEKNLAAAVTTDPTRVDWYTKPGPLPADQVRDELRINSTQLHRVMERRRKEATQKRKVKR